MTVKGIHATDWQQFHPDQLVNIWQFSYCDDRDLTFYCDGRASDVLTILGGKDIEDFVLEPVTDLGETITVADAIALRNELEIHPYQRSPNGEILQPTAIELVEEEGRVPWNSFGRGPISGIARGNFLTNPANAITGIAAILDRAAGIYETRANANIRDQAGVLGALYQGGHPEERVQGLLTRRGIDPRAQPKIPSRRDDGEALGEWVSRNRSWISNSFFSDCKKC